MGLCGQPQRNCFPDPGLPLNSDQRHGEYELLDPLMDRGERADGEKMRSSQKILIGTLAVAGISLAFLGDRLTGQAAGTEDIAGGCGAAPEETVESTFASDDEAAIAESALRAKKETCRSRKARSLVWSGLMKLRRMWRPFISRAASSLARTKDPTAKTRRSTFDQRRFTRCMNGQFRRALRTSKSVCNAQFAGGCLEKNQKGSYVYGMVRDWADSCKVSTFGLQHLGKTFFHAWKAQDPKFSELCRTRAGDIHTAAIRPPRASQECSFKKQDCGEGLSCYPTKRGARCRPTGGLFGGDSCDHLAACKQGYVCAGDPGQCVRACRSDEQCRKGDLCLANTSMREGAGICVPRCHTQSEKSCASGQCVAIKGKEPFGICSE